MASAPFWVLFKFVLFDVTGLFIRDWELELPSCGCRKRDVGISSGVSFIISLLEFWTTCNVPNALLHFVFHLRVGIKVACETCNLATNAPTTCLNARVCNQVGLYPNCLERFLKAQGYVTVACTCHSRCLYSIILPEWRSYSEIWAPRRDRQGMLDSSIWSDQTIFLWYIVAFQHISSWSNHFHH